MMRAVRSRAVTLGLWLGAAGLALTGLHCGEGTTGDRRIALTAAVRGARAEGSTAAGWTVTLTRAALVLGPLRYYADPAVVARAPLRRLGFSLGTAWAQHCHDCPAAPVAEFGIVSGGAVHRAVDLLAAQPTDLGPGNARNGTYRSASVAYAPGVTPVGDAALVASLGGRTLRLEGTAVRGGVTVRFAGGFDLGLQRVAGGGAAPGAERSYTAFGIPFGTGAGVFLDTPAEGGPRAPRTTLVVDPVKLLDQVDFAMLPPGEGDAPRSLPTEGQGAAALRLGAEDPRSYRVEYAPE